uniref:Uncharacterized protein n=1 Tax=Thermogemmatispora argillosa TaxID=2045280 RepID=A0A455T1B2_9CHLR|nr:hypothetical protein KTA_12010 [Thermogemmatispora argillosa]
MPVCHLHRREGGSMQKQPKPAAEEQQSSRLTNCLGFAFLIVFLAGFLGCCTISVLGRVGFWLNYATPHWHNNLLVVGMVDTTIDAGLGTLPIDVVYLQFSDGSSIYVSPRRVDEHRIIPGKTHVSYAQLQLDNPVLNTFFAWSDPYYDVATEVIILDPPPAGQ